jgi:hypothetical protein
MIAPEVIANIYSFITNDTIDYLYHSTRLEGIAKDQYALYPPNFTKDKRAHPAHIEKDKIMYNEKYVYPSAREHCIDIIDEVPDEIPDHVTIMDIHAGSGREFIIPPQIKTVCYSYSHGTPSPRIVADHDVRIEVSTNYLYYSLTRLTHKNTTAVITLTVYLNYEGDGDFTKYEDLRTVKINRDTPNGAYKFSPSIKKFYSGADLFYPIKLEDYPLLTEVSTTEWAVDLNDTDVAQIEHLKIHQMIGARFDLMTGLKTLRIDSSNINEPIIVSCPRVTLSGCNFVGLAGNITELSLHDSTYNSVTKIVLPGLEKLSLSDASIKLLDMIEAPHMYRLTIKTNFAQDIHVPTFPNLQKLKYYEGDMWGTFPSITADAQPNLIGFMAAYSDKLRWNDFGPLAASLFGEVPYKGYVKKKIDTAIFIKCCAPAQK